MSFVSAITQLFSRPATGVAPTGIAATAIVATTPGTLDPDLPTPIPDPPARSVAAINQHQERTLAYHNNEVTGQCSGKIQWLTDFVVICAFEDLPNWMKSLVVRLHIGVEVGSLTVTVRRVDGTLLSILAPGTLEENVALVGGQLQFECRTGSEPVRGIQYHISII